MKLIEHLRSRKIFQGTSGKIKKKMKEILSNLKKRKFRIVSIKMKKYKKQIKFLVAGDNLKRGIIKTHLKALNLKIYQNSTERPPKTTKKYKHVIKHYSSTMIKS